MRSPGDLLCVCFKHIILPPSPSRPPLLCSSSVRCTSVLLREVPSFAPFLHFFYLRGLFSWGSALWDPPLLFLRHVPYPHSHSTPHHFTTSRSHLALLPSLPPSSPIIRPHACPHAHTPPPLRCTHTPLKYCTGNTGCRPPAVDSACRHHHGRTYFYAGKSGSGEGEW